MTTQDGYYLEDLDVGMSDVFTKTVTEDDIVNFAGLTGDTNPLHLDHSYAEKTRFKERIAHGMLSASFISTVLGTRLPGPGCVYLSQSLAFHAPVKIGDTVTARATITKVLRETKRIVLETICMVGETVVIDGEAVLFVGKRPSSAAAE